MKIHKDFPKNNFLNQNLKIFQQGDDFRLRITEKFNKISVDI